MKFINLVGVENFIIYKFEDSIKYETGVVGAFLSVLGIPITDNVVNTQNQGLSNKAIDIIYYINSMQPLNLNGVKNKYRKEFDTLAFRKLSGNKFVLPEKFKKKFMKILSRIVYG